MTDLIGGLLTTDPWVELATRRVLLGEGEWATAVAAARNRVAADARVGDLFAALDPWPPRPSTGAYDPKDPIWAIVTLADFGLRADDPRVEQLADRLFASIAPDGTFRHGGYDHTRTYDQRGYQCVTHAVTEGLAGFGYAEDARLRPAVEQIRSTQRLDGGWHPNAALQPGGKRELEPSCPFGTLNVLRAAAAVGGELFNAVGPRAAGYLLDCWARRAEPYRPVGFGMGSTFSKLFYPFATYGILKVADTLSAVPAVRKDPRLDQLLSAVEAQGAPDGYRAGSVSRAWAAFDFGQKKGPSPWITFVALRARRRLDANA
jgi:hypothetical protein